MMNRLFVLGFVLLGSLSTAKAQDAVNLAANQNSAGDFAVTSAAQPMVSRALNLSSSQLALADMAAASARPVEAPMVVTALPATTSIAEPAEPSPKPRFLYGGRDDYRFQLGLGFTWTRFRSQQFNASALGLNTSLAYYTNDWFAIEGGLSTGFAPELPNGDHVKLLFYGVGPKIAWRQRRWEPWLHALVGGVHEQPQTASGGKNAFAVQAGGGADYRINPRLSGRLQADWIRTSLFNTSQNNFQLTGGIVIHF
jgi:opacity protein-like surface antigen